MVRAVLDKIFLASGVLACAFLASIAALVVLQVASRLGGLQIAGLDDYATYAMVASTFLGLAYALKRDSHIRVTLLLFAVPNGLKRMMEVLCLAIGAALMAYFAYFAALLTYDSWQFGMRSMGLAATPLWIPQFGMALGGAIAAVAFLDELIRALSGREPTYAAYAQAGILDDAGHHDPRTPDDTTETSESGPR